MPVRYFFSIVITIIIVLYMACSSGSRGYDKENWLKALNQENILEVKPEKIAEIKEIYKSPALTHIDDQAIYLFNYDDQTINIYSKENVRLKMTLGGKGEAPGEFLMVQAIRIYEDFIFVNSMGGKNSYFSKKGELLKEVRCPPHLIPCLPVGANFLTKEYSSLPEKPANDPYDYVKIVLTGPDFKIKKVLLHKKFNDSYVYNSQTGQREVWLFPDYYHYRVYKNNIYLGYSSKEGLYFYVFDFNGNKLYEITRPYQKRKIPDLIKRAIEKKQREINKKSYRKLEVKFYEHYPSFCNFEVSDDKIYIFLYPDINSQRVLILDLRGKLLEVNLVPFDYRMLEEKRFNTLFFNKIYNGMKYYLKDNAEKDTWEIWRLKLCSPKKKLVVPAKNFTWNQ